MYPPDYIKTSIEQLKRITLNKVSKDKKQSINFNDESINQFRGDSSFLNDQDEQSYDKIYKDEVFKVYLSEKII